MNAGIVTAAAGLFAVTNVDDILVLSLFFSRSAGKQGTTRRIVAGQYLGFATLLAITVAAAYGATFLPGPHDRRGGWRAGSRHYPFG